MSLNAESYLDAQSELYGRIARAEENLKKMGASKLSTGVVESRLQTLETNWEKFQKNHDVLRPNYKKTLTDHDYFKSDWLSTVEEMVMEQRGVLLDMLHSLRAKPVAGAEGTTAAEPALQRKLPHIELPHFSGRIEDWPSFRDLFLSMLDRHPSLAAVEKLHYLKTRVQGEAEERIRNLPTTGDNFERAWAILEERFENTRVLVRSCLTAFSATPRMKSESVADLKKLVNCMLQTAGTLETIGRRSAYDNDFFVHTVIEMLDPRSRREWEDAISSSRDPPSYDGLREFLERRLRTLEALHPAKQEPTSAASSKSSGTPSRSARANLAQKQMKGGRCPLCQKDHYILLCSEYRKKLPAQRKECVDTHSLCLNCLGKHPVAECHSKKACLACEARHHTTLHEVFTTPPKASGAAATSLHVRHQEGKRAAVLLATARVNVTDRYGNQHTVRALIDLGSEVSIVQEALAQRLRLPRLAASISIFGVGGQQTGTTRGRICLGMQSRTSDFSTQISALVLPRITAYGTRVETTATSWPHIEGLRLADPEYRAGDPVELLLGADVYAAILEEGLRKGGHQAPIAQCTTLGWILSGVVGNTANTLMTAAHQCQTSEDLADLVRQFWNQEEPPSNPAPLTEEEQHCEAFYASSHHRTPEGRYVVRLPMSTTPPDFSETRRTAARLVRCMERRFQTDPDFHRLYHDFMREYESLGHMEAAPPPSEVERVHTCYLPHHGVLKETDSGKRIRVVFNGSSRLASGDSLNAHLLAGPNLLPALADVLLRWRTHRFALAADIEKMYRQILIHQDDRDLQRIVWRPTASAALSDYQLQTVTYGLTCAPFLAIRTLRQLAKDEAERFPRAASVLQRDTYVDDVLTGTDTLDEAQMLRDELIGLCTAGGFPLSKWAANSSDLLRDIPENRRQLRDLREWEGDVGHSALGLLWHPRQDCFSFRVQKLHDGQVTKRVILSQVARLFDPMGWLSPVLIKAKILIQTMWLQQLEWDQPVHAKEERIWEELREDLPVLERIQVPRWVHCRMAGGTAEVHGFADASERAYAAAVYLRTHGRDGDCRVFLLQAKSKVAPVKPVSLPRLELCAAALLAKLTAHVLAVMDLPAVPLHLWSDSTVTLAWIQGHPARWKTYVANRVADIQRTLPNAQWHHIPGAENPADCASRGLSPRELLDHGLWWRGPTWLSRDELLPTYTPPPMESPPEERPRVHVAVVEPDQESLILQRFSRLQRLLRVTAWCCRWLGRRGVPSAAEPTLSPQEIEAARLRWVRLVQAWAYEEEIRALSRGSPIPRRSALVRMDPFVDEQGVLRVGGRLKHAILSPDERHPVILPRGSHFSTLTIRAWHLRALHGGVQLTLGMLRQHYWIPGGRQEVRRLIHRCVQCTRWRAASPKPMMGQLPTLRVVASRPFTHAGVDYAGPVLVRTAAGRGHKARKAFLAIFVCFATRAVHIELVSDYTADAFLAAFRRFVSRRGICSTLHSDRGTNFVGADAQLRSLFRKAVSENPQIGDALANEGVEWRFNPPAAPHFGGLWEAAVKSVKHHLRRVIGESTLTFEELSTVLTQIEACLNSRPLQAMSDDPEDISALTPGHFLTGAALTSLPESSLSAEPINRLTRWQLLQKMRDATSGRGGQRNTCYRSHRGSSGGDETPILASATCVSSEGRTSHQAGGRWHESSQSIQERTDRYGWSRCGWPTLRWFGRRPRSSCCPLPRANLRETQQPSNRSEAPPVLT